MKALVVAVLKISIIGHTINAEVTIKNDSPADVTVDDVEIGLAYLRRDNFEIITEGRRIERRYMCVKGRTGHHLSIPAGRHLTFNVRIDDEYRWPAGPQSYAISYVSWGTSNGRDVTIRSPAVKVTYTAPRPDAKFFFDGDVSPVNNGFTMGADKIATFGYERRYRVAGLDKLGHVVLVDHPTQPWYPDVVNVNPAYGASFSVGSFGGSGNGGDDDGGDVIVGTATGAGGRTQVPRVMVRRDLVSDYVDQPGLPVAQFARSLGNVTGRIAASPVPCSPQLLMPRVSSGDLAVAC